MFFDDTMAAPADEQAQDAVPEEPAMGDEEEVPAAEGEATDAPAAM